ncbi:phosphatase PAP2 family protein [Cytophagaceae bacterium YF14B1]|uniref:Phosphatase PAP2 family protein n=1 Tax=Xanthocytophaga flava TaxID=3048013 RepID=A0AAE3QNB4_9BACT|nr:phosphatase PAP2 family protein [Xanthocytophaga flavus]MDJ1479874.1 phosphatase PAP2 family protein [Xanthocytophaga flavus]
MNRSLSLKLYLGIVFLCFICYFWIDPLVAHQVGERTHSSIWEKISLLGSFEVSYQILVSYLVLFFILRYFFAFTLPPALVLMILYSYLTTVVSIQFLKTTLPRYRPVLLQKGFYGFDLHSSLAGSMDSFPSLHTGIFVALCIPLVFKFNRLGYILIPLILLVGLSRIFLNVHYVSDVVFSIGLSTGINTILYHFMKKDL